MVIKTVKIYLASLGEKYEFLADLHKIHLHKDPMWHFFLDEEGITLRFSKEFEGKVRDFCKKRVVRYSEVSDFEPSVHEYWGVRYIGDDLQPLFHQMSLLAIKYPRNVILRQVHERVNHIMVNQCGIHDFEQEAELYFDLGKGRLKLAAVRE